MSKSIKTFTKNQRTGLSGEDAFKAFLGNNTFNIEITQGFDNFFNGKSQRHFILRAVRIHQEDDMGLDFDVEIYWVRDNKYIATGMHFLVQLKTWGSCPSNLSLSDISYLLQQQRYGRSCFVVYQKINQESGVHEERLVLDFGSWIISNNNEYTLLEKNFLTIKDVDWQLFDDWIGEFVKKNIAKPIQRAIDNRYFEHFTSLETILRYHYPSPMLSRETILCGHVYFPLLILEINGKKIILGIDDISHSVIDLSLMHGETMGGSNMITFLPGDLKKYKDKFEEKTLNSGAVIFQSDTHANATLKRVMEDAYPNRRYLPINVLFARSKESFSKIIAEIDSIFQNEK